MCTLYNCSGLFRCINSGAKVCLHLTSVCDSFKDCFLGENEYLCTVISTCPDHCYCLMYAVKCSHSYIDGLILLFHSDILFFKLHNISVHTYNLKPNFYLRYTITVFIWTRSSLVTILPLINLISNTLKFLDLTHNKIKLLQASYFKGVPLLEVLLFSNSKLATIKPLTFKNLNSLVKLDASCNWYISLG